MPRWITWVGVVLLSGAGLLAGAGVARAFVGPVRRRVDPALDRAAANAVARYGSSVPLGVLTDHAYWAARPGCPKQLDPSNPAHAECTRAWLQLRDLVSAKLPPPEIPRPEDRPDLPSEGPAADLRGWLGSLSQDQREGLRQMIGARHYDALAKNAAGGDDEGTVKAMLDLKEEIELLADDDPLEALRRYRELKGLLGPRFDELLRLAEKYRQSA